MSGHNAFGDYMIGVLLQPSLSSTHHDGSSCSRASAFLLQTLPQSRIMVGFGHNAFTRMKGMISSGGRGYGQVAHTKIHPCNSCMSLGSGICYIKSKGDQQIELLAWLVIPELGRSNHCSLVQQGHMLAIARI